MKYVAFLRSINVGTYNRVKMEDLRRALAVAGLEGAETYLQSGNVLFESKCSEIETLESLFEKAFQTLSIKSTAVIRSAREMQAMIDADPFVRFSEPAQDRFVLFGHRPLEIVLPAEPGGLLSPVEIAWKSDRDICFVSRPTSGVHPSPKLPSKLVTTTRNWTVTQAIASKLTG